MSDRVDILLKTDAPDLADRLHRDSMFIQTAISDLVDMVADSESELGKLDAKIIVLTCKLDEARKLAEEWRNYGRNNGGCCGCCSDGDQSCVLLTRPGRTWQLPWEGE